MADSIAGDREPPESKRPGRIAKEYYVVVAAAVTAFFGFGANALSTMMASHNGVRIERQKMCTELARQALAGDIESAKRNLRFLQASGLLDGCGIDVVAPLDVPATSPGSLGAYVWAILPARGETHRVVWQLKNCPDGAVVEERVHSFDAGMIGLYTCMIGDGGALTGPTEGFDLETGNTVLTGRRLDGQFDGAIQVSYVGGRTKRELTYRSGVRHGWLVDYAEDGTFRSGTCYVDGNATAETVFIRDVATPCP